jgi:hypothetical protein
MKSIQEVVGAKVSGMISDGTIEKLIGDSVEKAISSAIKQQFESYGSITKQIELAIKDGLKINTKDLPFEAYNAQMLVAVKQKLGDMFRGQSCERFLDEIDRLLEPAPAEVSIVDFLEKIAGFWKTDEPWDADDLDEYMTVEIEPYRSRGDDGDWNIKIWKKKDRYSGSRNADIDLFLLGNKIRISHKQCFNPTSFHDEEAYIFKLYGAGTTITGIANCDPESLDLRLKETEY